ncbi:hypothetical protein ACJRW5_05375 [Pseudomonas sp. SH1-B]
MIKYLVLSFISFVATFVLRDTVLSVSYSDYKDTLSALLNISSIIFAIIGAWIAIIYPRAIGRAFKGVTPADKALKDANTDASYLSELVEIVMVSAIVLMIVLFVHFAVPFARILISGDFVVYAKYFGFFLFSLLTLAQLYAVFRVILANYFFLNEIRNKNVDDHIDTLHK